MTTQCVPGVSDFDVLTTTKQGPRKSPISSADRTSTYCPKR